MFDGVVYMIRNHSNFYSPFYLSRSVNKEYFDVAREKFSYRSSVLHGGYFCDCLLVYCYKKTALRKVEVIDFLLLSSIAIFPAVFVLFQDFTLLVSHSLGIRSPLF